ncbi:8635_t:CDS:2 [Gigaspora margarita]|uniref:8635_t:CDS:1 n=1 Tax=Gigaspora margarita TaxID=4874 RepID=A0ABN7URI1_GIGMA|nr:8635_t:CDS:2 [Gigaspora margarita]
MSVQIPGKIYPLSIKISRHFISFVNFGLFNQCSHLQLHRSFNEIIVESEKDFDERFVWDKRSEDQHAKDLKDDNDHVHKRGYMSYLSDNISIPSEFVWYDPKSKKDLFSINNSSLPYNISGTTDVLIMDKGFYKVLDFRSGIRAGFELKKNVQDSDINQAMVKLIVANIGSNHAVFMSRIETSREALAIIERALVRRSTATTTLDSNFPIEMRCNYFRMRDFQPGDVIENETNALDSFLNRPKVQFDFDDDIANMKDMFDDMTEKEITDWKVRRVLRLLENTPGN